MGEYSIHIQEKPKQQPKTISGNVNGWPDRGVYRVTVTHGDAGDFQVGERWLFVPGGFVRLEHGQIVSFSQSDWTFRGKSVSVVRDYSVAKVTLHIDDTPSPEYQP